MILLKITERMISLRPSKQIYPIERIISAASYLTAGGAADSSDYEEACNAVSALSYYAVNISFDIIFYNSYFSRACICNSI